MNDLLFFDIDIIGTIKDPKAKFSDLDNWPRIAQIAWTRTDHKGKIIKVNSMLARPDGFEIEPNSSRSERGFTQANSIKFGIPVKNILLLFIQDLNESDFIVTHNMAIYYPILCAEIIRAELKPKSRPGRFCVMDVACGSEDWFVPLLDVYESVFNVPYPDDRTDRYADLHAIHKVFFELLRQNKLTLD